MKKGLAKIVLLGTLALASAGCSTRNSEYNFNGKIGKDSVSFEGSVDVFRSSIYQNNLTVTKPDGTVIKYRDFIGDDLKLEEVDITKNGKTTEYFSSDKFQKPIVDSAQVQFNDYLKKIGETKTKQGLEDLK